MCQNCIDTASAAVEASVADLLDFEAWPAELRRIARAAIGEEMREARDERTEERFSTAYGSVLDDVAKAEEQLDDLIAELEKGGSIGEGYAVKAREIRKVLADLPSELSV
jgi:hypothetical protein